MHRVLFKIGNFEIYTYGFTLVLGFMTALFVTVLRNRREHKNIINDDIIDFGFYLLLAGIAGSRIVYVLLHLPEYIHHPLSIINLREGGLAWHGALLGGVIAFWIYSRRRKIDLMEFLDLVAPQVLLGLSIGRIGCFMNGCCLGHETHVPWGVVFSDAGYTVPRHPTQIYEIILNMMIFFFLLKWDRKKKFSGEILIMMFALYSIDRLIVEFFRFSPPRILGLSYAQYFSIIFTTFCFFWIAEGRKRGTVNVFAARKSEMEGQ